MFNRNKYAAENSVSLLANRRVFTFKICSKECHVKYLLGIIRYTYKYKDTNTYVKEEGFSTNASIK